MSSLFNSLLFDFKEIKIKSLQNNNFTIVTALKDFVDELNKKIDHRSLNFEYDYDNNAKIFYLKLKIDNSKYLNILRANMGIKDQETKDILQRTQKYKIISFNEIVWMYCLSEKFMNKIFKEGKKLLPTKNDKFYYFYLIMSKYYDVVDIQMDRYFENIKKRNHFYDIIHIYNFNILNGYYKKYIRDFNKFIK